MVADVELLSGFTEQLRNVYAKLTTMSAGPSFCSLDSAGSHSDLSGAIGLYSYPPIDGNTGHNPRSKTWSIALTSNDLFWFVGELWGLPVPSEPGIGLPTEQGTVSSGGLTSKVVTISWTLDPLANNTDPDGAGVLTPLAVGAQVSLYYATNFTNCSGALIEGPVNVTGTTWTSTKTVAATTSGRYVCAKLATRFTLPGSSMVITGSLVRDLHFLHQR
jgi:hypothetical protein